MGEIKICEKPEWISWNDIHECLYTAHSSNREKGINMLTQRLSGPELEDRINRKSSQYHAIVALDNKKLVGTASICFVRKKIWSHEYWGGYFLYEGIYPEYKGQGIFTRLCKYREELAIRNNCEIIFLDTAEKNDRRQLIAKKDGYIYVDMFASRNSKHYSVVMAKWLDETKYPRFTSLRYWIRVVKVKLIYQPGHKRRF